MKVRGERSTGRTLHQVLRQERGRARGAAAVPGRQPGEGAARAPRSSPLYWVTPNAVPTLCVHGTEDKYVHVEQAELLVDKLKATGVEAELLKLEGAGHGFKGKDAEAA